MKQTFLRAVACAGLCASLTGCGGNLGQIGAGLLAGALAAVATVAKEAAKGDHSHESTVAPAKATRVATYPDHEDPEMLTCDAKRREFLSVYQGERPLPPQLVCTAEGEFGALGGARARAEADDETL